ncbi:FKBP-type peptidyl-prolyl cis-trans isomerase [Porphyromonas pogonae]|uniref:FKBP-type peptidyl-prolyl cis-trans isomerase n=1 Tax=Porphyromonas pogonae TaxID=867595 RepID=UPI002E7A4E68|nr:FKBP-type peptidyl-prolyl cis-trans isomerase [Porphyromonas pogonae]
MKKLTMALAGAALLLGAVSCNKSGSKKVEPKTEKDSLACAIGMMYGDQMAQTIQMSAEQGQKIDSMEFLRGFKEALKDSTRFSYYAGGLTAMNIGKQLRADSVDMDKFYEVFHAKILRDSLNKPMSDSVAQNFMNNYQSRKQKAEAMKTYGKNIEDGKKFIEKFRTEANVKTTPSGLSYIVLKEGTGATPKAEDKVKVKYVGTLIDGTEFDKNEEGIEFNVNGVIKGWTEMLMLMKEGEKVKVVIPQELAYGERGNYSIPPFSTLIFEVELVKVVK